MNLELEERRSISLALAAPGRIYGVGFNCTVIIRHRGLAPFAEFDAVLAEVDHRHLGLDFDLGFASPMADLETLAGWLHARLRAAGLQTLKALSLERGDGFKVDLVAGLGDVAAGGGERVGLTDQLHQPGEI